MRNGRLRQPNKTPGRSHKAAWIIKLMITCGAVLGLLLWHNVIADYREQIAQQKQRMAEEQKAVVRLYNTQADLVRDAAVINDISSYLISSQEELSNVVGTIETAARQTKVAVKVPKVEEFIVSQERAAPLPEQFQGVQLSIIATGTPDQILTFLYSIEHVPLASYINSWRITMKSQQTATNTSLPVSELQATMQVVMKKNND